jgi:signal transduction histidine kinase
MLFGTDPSAEAIQQLKSAISSQSEYRTTLQCLRKDGQPFWNDISIAPVRSGLGMTTHIVAVMNDVSEHRQAQKQLLQSERLAAIGQMVTGLAHESRNALQRAQACLDMLSLDLEDQPEQLDLTNKTRRALQDLHRYYEEVRNYAAPINLELRPVNLAKLWQDTWRNLDTAHGDRDFTLVEPSLDFEPVCSIDSHRIEQVFRNIMENALAACPDPGSLTISCEQASNPNTHQQGLQIRFTDNGPGFEPESAASIFQPFFTTKQKGTGLGMAIAKRIVEAHGGRISVDGSSSPGATIEIFLPAQPVTAMATRSEPVAT